MNGADRMNRLLTEAEGGDKWIQKAIKRPGRCKDFGGPDCPPGSPQYNLAKRFKKGGDLHKGEAAPSKRKEPEGYSAMGAQMRAQLAWWTKDYPQLRKRMQKWGDLGTQFMKLLDPVHASMKKIAPWF